ncbi:hypothetical protein DFH27DRAFT_366160 [Peziza echinospora]|nr:hypothetical protein DFH27DRAFT_366160 [Peziza echinospora]
MPRFRWILDIQSEKKKKKRLYRSLPLTYPPPRRCIYPPSVFYLFSPPSYFLIFLFSYQSSPPSCGIFLDVCIYPTLLLLSTPSIPPPLFLPVPLHHDFHRNLFSHRLYLYLYILYLRLPFPFCTFEFSSPTHMIPLFFSFLLSLRSFVRSFLLYIYIHDDDHFF